MSKHHKVVKENASKRLMQKALDYLIEESENTPITLGEKEYNTINFSYSQVIAAMHQLAGPLDIANNALFTSTAAISQNQAYKLMISDAKIKFSEKTTGNRNLTLPNRKLSEMEYQLCIQGLMHDKNVLQEQNDGYRSVIEQAQLKITSNEKSVLINAEDTSMVKQGEILVRLLQTLTESMIAYIKPTRSGVPAQLWLDDSDGQFKICNLEDLDGLNITYEKDANGMLLAKASK